MPGVNDNEICCSFCGKPQAVAERLIAGSGVYICDACVRLCPAGALWGKLWKTGMEREQLFQREICKKTQIERMKANTGIETDLCGLCFAVCPYTEKYLAEK